MYWQHKQQEYFSRSRDEDKGTRNMQQIHVNFSYGISSALALCLQKGDANTVLQ